MSYEDYKTSFDPKSYLTQFYNSNYPLSTALLKPLCKFYQTVGHDAGLTVLDFGCGPTIHGIISLAQYSASEIVLAEYLEKNRREIHKWIQEDNDAFDWTSIIRHVVVELEEKEESEVEERKQQLQHAIKSVIPCDVTKDPVLSPEYMKEYDIVHCFLCLEAASRTKEEFVAYLLKLKSLIKPGGKFLLLTVNREERPEPVGYKVGDHWFYDLCISVEFVQESLTKIGFTDLVTIPIFTVEASAKDHNAPSTFNLHIATKP